MRTMRTLALAGGLLALTAGPALAREPVPEGEGTVAERTFLCHFVTLAEARAVDDGVATRTVDGDTCYYVTATGDERLAVEVRVEDTVAAAKRAYRDARRRGTPAYGGKGCVDRPVGARAAWCDLGSYHQLVVRKGTTVLVLLDLGGAGRAAIERLARKAVGRI